MTIISETYTAFRRKNERVSNVMSNQTFQEVWTTTQRSRIHKNEIERIHLCSHYSPSDITLAEFEETRSDVERERMWLENQSEGQTNGEWNGVYFARIICKVCDNKKAARAKLMYQRLLKKITADLFPPSMKNGKQSNEAVIPTVPQKKSFGTCSGN